jgi:tetratricopeptide (TPR) repeat protein
VLRTLIVRGNFAVIVGDVIEALQAHRAAEQLAAALDWDLMKAVAALNIAYDAFFAGDLAEARRAGKRAVRLSSAAGAPRVQIDALLSLAVTERERGAFDSALASLEAALAHARTDPDDAATLSVTLAHIAETNRRAGRSEQARRAADEMLSVFVEADAMRPQLSLWIAAQVYLDSEPLRAAAYLRRAHDLLQQQGRAIPDTRAHAAFLALPYNREIIVTYEAWLAAGRFSDAVGASLSS